MSNRKCQENPDGSFPEPLQPAEGFQDWRKCLPPGFQNIVKDFTTQFRAGQEEGTAALLSITAHSMGESVQAALPHRKLSPPFSLLHVTPEKDPVWPQALQQILRTGLANCMQHVFDDSTPPKENSRKGDSTDGSPTRMAGSGNPESKLFRADDYHARQSGVASAIIDNPRPPFVCSPLDRSVTLITPRSGLLRSLSRLSGLGRLGLEEALMGVSTPTVPNPDRRMLPPKLSFLWQLPESDATSFFRQHGGWLELVPFVITRGTRDSFPCLDQNSPVFRQYAILVMRLLEKRLSRCGDPVILDIGSDIARPSMSFLDRVSKWQISGRESDSLQWVTDLGVRLSLCLMRLEGERELTLRYMVHGLELAKFFARRRIQILSAHDRRQVAEIAETADLSPEEQKAYLKICAKGGMTMAELRRSSHGMSARSRDSIVTKLLAAGLIYYDDDVLRQNAA